MRVTTGTIGTELWSPLRSPEVVSLELSGHGDTQKKPDKLTIACAIWCTWDTTWDSPWPCGTLHVMGIHMKDAGKAGLSNGVTGKLQEVTVTGSLHDDTPPLTN